MYKSNISSCISHYIRTYYENSIETKVGSNPDYEAIFWLIKSQYINHQEAKIFIENIILEVFKLLLKVYKGSYDFSPQLCLQEITHFYTWEVKYLVHSLLLNHNSKNNISGSYIVNDISRQQESRLTKAIDFIYKNKLSSDIKRKSSFSLTKGRKIYKIICIDDDPIILKTICNFLDEEIFNFIGILDPLQALNKLIELQPDLILLDIEMPFLDGYELYSLLQKHPYLRNIPVVIITGRNGALDQAKARIIRVADYLTKPFTQLDLVRSICHNLQYVDE